MCEKAGLTREEASEAMSSLEKARDRLIEITADEQITEDELDDFVRIEEGIKSIGLAADS